MVGVGRPNCGYVFRIVFRVRCIAFRCASVRHISRAMLDCAASWRKCIRTTFADEVGKCRVCTQMSIRPFNGKPIQSPENAKHTHKYSLSSSLCERIEMHVFRVSLPISEMMKSIGQIGFAIFGAGVGGQCMLPIITGRKSQCHRHRPTPVSSQQQTEMRC